MNIHWIISDDFILDPSVDINTLHKIGSFWGSWRTWRPYQTDNVVCHGLQRAQQLIQTQFNEKCNFYIPNENYVALNKPPKVNIYEGSFMGHEVVNQDELVAMNLASSMADIILLLGFIGYEVDALSDVVSETRAKNYRGLFKHTITSHSNTQWILVDHPEPIRSDLAGLTNLGRENLDSVIKMLSN